MWGLPEMTMNVIQKWGCEKQNWFDMISQYGTYLLFHSTIRFSDFYAVFGVPSDPSGTANGTSLDFVILNQPFLTGRKKTWPSPQPQILRIFRSWASLNACVSRFPHDSWQRRMDFGWCGFLPFRKPQNRTWVGSKRHVHIPQTWNGDGRKPMKYHMFGGLKSSQFQCVKNIQVAPRYRSIFHGPKEKLMSIGRYIAYRFLFYFSAYICICMYIYIHIYMGMGQSLF